VFGSLRVGRMAELMGFERAIDAGVKLVLVGFIWRVNWWYGRGVRIWLVSVCTAAISAFFQCHAGCLLQSTAPCVVVIQSGAGSQHGVSQR
jgi:hypothetical protein